jgi:GTP-binding protein
MTEGNFVDYVKIFVSSGKGGKGSTHLHREKFIEKVQMVVMVVVEDTYI